MLHYLSRVLALVAMLVSPVALATMQQPDLLLVDGQQKALLTSPLQPFIAANPNVVPLAETVSSGNRRGYIAHWKISAGELVLTSLMVNKWRVKGGREELEPEESLRQVFPGRAPVVARWYSGVVILRHGGRSGPIPEGRRVGTLLYRVYTLRKGRLIETQDLDTLELSDLYERKFSTYKLTPMFEQHRDIVMKDWAGTAQEAEQILHRDAKEYYLATE